MSTFYTGEGGDSSIAGLKSSVAFQEGKKKELEALLKSLQSFDPTIKYVLQSHGHIKHTYFLGGKKYAEETKTEQDSVNNQQRNLITHIDNAEIAVKAAIQNCETYISQLNSQIKTLEANKKKK